MAKYELILPKMGESVAEASITNWLKNVGDTIEADEVVLEVATDKVDTEVPCDVEGILREKLFEEGDVIKVGQAIAIIDTDMDVKVSVEEEVELDKEVELSAASIEEQIEHVTATNQINITGSSSSRFYSPLVKNIANQEGITEVELDSIKGTGVGDRVTKNDILEYIAENKGVSKQANVESLSVVNKQKEVGTVQPNLPKPPVGSAVKQEVKSSTPLIVPSADDEIVEMSRMGKIISEHMTNSLATSAHVQSFIEADVTNVWKWRASIKDEFFKRENEKITFTPIFMEVIAQALKDFPLMNISVEGNKIIKRKNINIGMATALPDGNLIVPVIKNADQLNLTGMTKKVNDLAKRARENKLDPDDIKEGTYTVTNIGSFGTVMGTPIINQPQVGILALGAIRKVPAVIETPEGDTIGIRYRMFLSHSYDHRVVNGALGGQFVQRVKEHLEKWDVNRLI